MTLRWREFLELVSEEADRAVESYGDYHSAHEAYAVLKEEVDEFWEEVKKKRSERDLNNMRAELIQIAAICAKAADSLGLMAPKGN